MPVGVLSGVVGVLVVVAIYFLVVRKVQPKSDAQQQ